MWVAEKENDWNHYCLWGIRNKIARLKLYYVTLTRVYPLCTCALWVSYRVFSLTWPASMQIYWNKRKRLHKKRVQLPEDWFGTPTWPPFHCFGTSTSLHGRRFIVLRHHNGRRDVMWKHSIKSWLLFPITSSKFWVLRTPFNALPSDPPLTYPQLLPAPIP